MKKWRILVWFLLLVFAIAWLGNVFTMSSVYTWYPTLQKTSWNPPNWVFGPVWTVLYIMIAVSGWLIFLRKASRQRQQALIVYGIQLGLNIAWSFFFFYLRSPSLALLDLLLLILFIIWTIKLFWLQSRLAAYLLFPYLVWTLYALTLNAGTRFLNS